MGVDWEKTWEADLPIQESFLQLQKFSIATVPHSLQDYFGPAGRGRIMRLRSFGENTRRIRRTLVAGAMMEPLP
jgi:hypothetical protein